MGGDRHATTVCKCSKCSQLTYKDENGVECVGQLRRPAMALRHARLDQLRKDLVILHASTQDLSGRLQRLSVLLQRVEALTVSMKQISECERSPMNEISMPVPLNLGLYGLHDIWQ